MATVTYNSWTHKGEEVHKLPPGVFGFLYLIITPEHMGRKYYIGQCSVKAWGSYWGGGKELRAYYAEHSKAGCRRIILCYFDNAKELDDAEISLTRNINVRDHPAYYNLVNGGKSAVAQDKSIRAKISAKQKKRVFTDEHRRKISIANTGKGHPQTAASKAKISAARKGMVFSDEHRENLSKALSGRKIPQEVIDKREATNRAKREAKKNG